MVLGKRAESAIPISPWQRPAVQAAKRERKGSTESDYGNGNDANSVSVNRLDIQHIHKATTLVE